MLMPLDFASKETVPETVASSVRGASFLRENLSGSLNSEMPTWRMGTAVPWMVCSGAFWTSGRLLR